MPLFAHVDTHIVTFRPYEYNVEYIEGSLELIPDDEICHVVTHHPNRKFGYDVGIIDTTAASTGWEKVEKLGHFNPDEPAQIYYELVPAKHYKDYITKENFYTSKKFKVVSTNLVPEQKVIKEAYELPSITKSNIQKTPDLVLREPRLVRTTEKALYKYKKPNEKFGT